MERLFHSEMTKIRAAGESGSESHAAVTSRLLFWKNWEPTKWLVEGWYKCAQVEHIGKLSTSASPYFICCSPPWGDADPAHPVSGTSWHSPVHHLLPPVAITVAWMQGRPRPPQSWASAESGCASALYKCMRHGRRKGASGIPSRHSEKDIAWCEGAGAVSSDLRSWAELKMANVIGDVTPLIKHMLCKASCKFGFSCSSSWNIAANLGGWKINIQMSV